MMIRRLKISALLASTCVAVLPRAVSAQAADAPPVETPKPADAAAQEEHAAAQAGSEVPPGPKPVEQPAKPEAVVTVASPATEAKSSGHGDRLPSAGYVPGYRTYVGVGAAPFIPRVGALPGGLTPSFGSSVPSDDWSFNFSGFMSASVRASINTREHPRPGQSKTVFHSTPQNVEVYGSFNDTGSTPGNWVGLLFAYGNRYVTANVSFDTHNPSRASGYEIVGSQYFINDTFLSFRIPPLDRLRLYANVGFFSQPYGYLGQYGGGLYTPPLLGRVSGVGETLTAEYDLSDNVSLLLEDGFSGGGITGGNKLGGKIPQGALNTGSTNFSDSNLPPAFVHHAFVGVRKKGETTFQLTAHFLTNFSQTDQVPAATFDNPDTRQWDERYPKDGRIHVAGLEAKAVSQTYGYLALAAAMVDAKNAYRLRGLSTFAGDGVSLTNDWFGGTTGGTGRLLLAGVNYRFSLGSILRAPAPFWGDAPDVVVEAAFQMASTKSDDPGFSGRFKQKAGLDVLYTFLPWLGAGLRLDRIEPNSKDPEETFYALAPRLQFRSNWTSHETVTLKYSKWFYGKHTHSDSWDARPRAQLDDQMIGLGFGMWW
jgi:hypothetical protein